MSFFSRKSQMSLQKGQRSLQKGKGLSFQQTSNYSATNFVQNIYTMILQSKDPKSSDPNVTCTFQLQKDPSWKKVYLDIRSMSTMVLGAMNGQLPGSITLRAIQQSGSVNPSTNLPTKNLAVSKPRSITTGTSFGDVSTYHACYQLSNTQCLWDVSDLLSINFYAAIGNQPVGIQAPYTNQIVVQFAIIGVK